ncbi:DUF5362 family protein [Prosthecobacter sp.]|uniref:DUF5362 family protein n=1 Tax=Prosthecobacter sp. TaxID=1965333 RepID=UPI002487F10C|nr:DUF5362 family protein [Prosthecobacter sp.]MDI1312660.1 DUF5362 family protein [Prosthecobacter sp.]
MSAYLITRDGQELGSFDATQIQEGLKTGFFQATDWGWREGMTGWQGLTEIVGTAAPANTAPQARTNAAPSSAPITKPKGLTPANVNPYAAPSAKTQSGAIGAVPLPIIAELTGTKPWVRLISILMWLVCALFLLSIVGNLIIGVVTASAMADKGNGGMGFGMLVFMMVFFGITAMLIVYPTLKLSKYASCISRLAESQSFTDLTAALAEQRRFWKFYGIITLIYLIFAALFLLLMVAGVGLGSMAH